MIPFTNKKDHVVWVNGKRVNPNETCVFENGEVPAHLCLPAPKAAPAQKQESFTDTLIPKRISDITDVFDVLSLEQLDELEIAEVAGENRKGLIEAIIVERLKRASE